LIGGMTRACARVGYAHVSVAETIAEAGVSRSSFYAHFDDTDACFIAALRACADRFAAAGQKVVAASSTPVGACVQTIVELAEAEPDSAKLLLCESLGAFPEAHAIRNEAIVGLATAVEQRWQEVDESAAAPDVDAPALALVGGVCRLLAFRLRSGVSGLHELHEQLDAWIGSYARVERDVRWRQGSSTIAATGTVSSGAGAVPATLPRGRHRLGAAEVARNQRQRIAQATARGALEKGYANLTVSDIVSLARISRTVFYTHFADKQEAAGEALQLYFEGAMTVAARAFFTATAWPDRLLSAGAALSSHASSEPELVHLAFVELHALGPEIVRLAHHRLMAFTLLFEEGFRQRPEAEALPRSIAETLAATAFELVYLDLPRARGPRLQCRHGALAYACLAPFVGVEEADGLVDERPAELVER
jgi:AcrR family transcriptional regulator